MDSRLVTRLQVEEFLARETEMLDHHDYQSWLGTLTDDLLYWAPIVETVASRRDLSNRVGELTDSAYFCDTKTTLTQRVKRLEAGNAWAEAPPSRTCRLISNILVKEDRGDSLDTTSSFHIYRSRMAAQEDQYFGTRMDTWRRTQCGDFALAARKIVFTQALLTSRSISIFF